MISLGGNPTAVVGQSTRGSCSASLHAANLIFLSQSSLVEGGGGKFIIQQNEHGELFPPPRLRVGRALGVIYDFEAPFHGKYNCGAHLDIKFFPAIPVTDA